MMKKKIIIKKKINLENNYINDDKDDMHELNNDIEECNIFELDKELYSKKYI